DGLAARVIERERAEQNAEVERQKAAQKLNVIPFPKLSGQPFRSELTIERHPLFVSNTFKAGFWRYERALKQADTGEELIQRVLVGKVNENDRPRGVLTQIHQQVLYQLLALWGERGYPISEINGRHFGAFTISAYDLVVALRGSDAGKDYRRVE